MKNSLHLHENAGRNHFGSRVNRGVAPPQSALHLVSRHAVENLRESLARGRVPLDLLGKLARLQRGSVIDHFIQQNCRLILELLQAAQEGSFRLANAAELERLLRVLAYVRLDDDLIPDYQSGGYVDDHRELREALRELAPLVEAFKHWRLRHQVPAMWSEMDLLCPGGRHRGPAVRSPL